MGSQQNSIQHWYVLNFQTHIYDSTTICKLAILHSRVFKVERPTDIKKNLN